MSDNNKAIVRRLVQEGFNEGKLEVFDELVSPDFVDHAASPGIPPTLDGWKQATAGMRRSFPDLHIHIEEEIAEGDRVVDRMTTYGTDQGGFMGRPATGKEVSVASIYILRLADGKIVERWGQADYMGMMMQLGVIPPPGG